MNQSTFDTFVRRTSTLFDRRALFGGASAALLAATGLPLGTEAKKGKKKRNRDGKACRKRVKQCRKDVLPECEIIPFPNCESIVKKCCKKACESRDKADACLDKFD